MPTHVLEHRESAFESSAVLQCALRSHDALRWTFPVSLSGTHFRWVGLDGNTSDVWAEDLETSQKKTWIMRLLARANWYNLRWLSFLPMAVAELVARLFDKFEGDWFISVNGL
ncbi:hypothetical protein Amsp01_016280 [Amycolatopsis sp. NBRC 101858]|nr:hypothetical protein Amsp01_016280 [Amycolatopsis sp. NBRC 101858]